MGMITRYSCWRLGRQGFFVMAAEVTTPLMQFYILAHDGDCQAVDMGGPPLEVKLIYPCAWPALPWEGRMKLRRHFEGLVNKALLWREENPMSGPPVEVKCVLDCR